LGEVEDWSSRAEGDGGRPTALVKSAAVAHVREKEREKKEEEADAGFKYELVTPI
jgi:hypothetical protein